MTTLDRAKQIAALIDNKKGEEVRVLQIGTLTTIGDYFVVATGNSTTQVKALADEVEEKLSAEAGLGQFFLKSPLVFCGIARLCGYGPDSVCTK